MKIFAHCLATLGLLTVALSPAAATAAELKLIASNAMKEIIDAVVPQFEKSTGQKVTLAWGGTEAITARISKGEPADVVVIAASNIDKLIADGHLAAGSRADIAKSGVGVAVREGMPKADISSGEAVKSAVLSAKSVAYSSGPSGFYLAELFKRMGIADQIKGKVKQPPSGVQVADLLARGEADLGFQQVSELLHAKGVAYLGPLPADIQQVTIFSAAMSPRSSSPDAAKALVKFLTGPNAAPIIRTSGMEPG
jgi:molybdate transport system substrate-binding protein